MGNISTRPVSKKIQMLNEEVNDVSANITSNIIAEATQNIAVNQEQNIVIKNATFTNCDVSLQQEADVTAKQIAVFKVFLSNPRQVLKKLTQGPNSMFGQVFDSKSPVMNQFLDTARSNFGVSTNAELRQKMTNIMKLNISQNAIAKATQNIMVNQTQNVFMDGIKCEGSKINITQKAVVDATQNVMVQIVMNAMSSNPQFRQTVRQMNGDYNKDLMNEEIDTGVEIPAACMDDLKPSQRQAVCDECEACPVCPIPEPCNLSCPKCSDYVLNATIIYGILGVFLFLLLIGIILK
jgi:hypothetical protein